jgi:nucleoside-diphosphate-sugar epimerase
VVVEARARGRAGVSVLAVTGASGFVGREFLASLPAGRHAELRLLVHRARPERLPEGTRVIPVVGDLRDPASLRALLTPGCTVVHLAQLTKPHPVEDNVAVARSLAAACRDAGVARIVHCSTAVLVGDVPDDVITEATPCRPATDYERAKYRIEEEMREAAAGHHELAILRPTVVFGPGGRNLMSQARRIARKGPLANLLYSALQGRRRMNLVSVHNVAAALVFLAGAQRGVDGQAYIVSDDADPANNYRDLAEILAREFGRGRVAGSFELPPAFLATSLKFRGRSNLNSRRVYADDKLRAAGYVKPWAFEAALVEFAQWARGELLPGSAPR